MSTPKPVTVASSLKNGQLGDGWSSDVRPQLLEKLEKCQEVALGSFHKPELETPRKANVWFNLPEQVDQLYL